MMTPDAPGHGMKEGARLDAVVLVGIARVFAGETVAIQEIDLRIARGGFLALTGPSGCGKTTILRLVAGLDAPSSGFVRLDGGAPADASGVACCFQDPRLLPWRNVQRNVELPLELLGVESAERRTRAREVIDRVGLTEAARRLPHQLSGGMRMRASLARALVVRPRILLLDEPFGALDEVTREQLDDELVRLWMEDQMTVMLVTHSIREAVYLAEDVVVMTPGPGRIVGKFEIDIGSRNEQTRTSASFNDQVRLVQASLREGSSS